MRTLQSESETAAEPVVSTGLALAALALLAVCAFLPVLWGEFVSDDQALIVQNPLLDSASGLWRIWSSLDPLDPWPVSYSAFWALKNLFGENALAFHAANLALHVINACLLLLLLRRLAVPGAWLIAALWAVHPVQTETVAWASEMKNTLCALFAFLSLLSYLRFDELERRRDFALALVFFALSLLSKSASAPLPAVLLMLLWWKKGRLERADFLRSIPFWILAAACAVATIWFQTHRSGGEVSALGWSLQGRVENAGYALACYVAKLLAPWTCSFHVGHPEMSDRGGLLLILFALEIATLFFLWRMRHRWGKAAFVGMAIFFLLLSPVLGFVDHYVLRFSPIADRWQYLGGTAPIALLIAWGAKWTRSVSIPARRIAAAALVLFLAGLSWQRALVFGSEQRLWEDTLQRNPNSSLAHAGLGRIAALQLDWDRAQRLLIEALRLDPGFLLARHYLGSVYEVRGNDAGAEAAWRETIALAPNFALAHESLGKLFLKRGRTQEAIAELEAVLALQPSHRQARLDLAQAYQLVGREEDARALLKKWPP